MNHFPAQYQNNAYNQKSNDEFLYNALEQPASGGYLEQFERNVVSRPLTEWEVPFDQVNWFNMTNQMTSAFPVSNNFLQINRYLPHDYTPTANFLPFYQTTSKSSRPVSNLSDQEESNVSQFSMQMLPGNAAVLSEGANAVDVHPNFLRGKVDEWEKTFRKQYGNKKESNVRRTHETRGTFNFMPSCSGDHLKNCLQEQLEEHRSYHSQLAVSAATYIGDTLEKVNYHRDIGLNKWAIDDIHLADEYWAAVDLYQKTVCIKEPLSVEIATECSRRRIGELATENNRNVLLISLAYSFAISTMNPELARDINAVMSYQNEPETFERLENYFAERYKREMDQLSPGKF